MYCTKSNVKDALGISKSEYDNRIQEYIDAAAKWINEYCQFDDLDRPFAIAGETTRYFHPEHTKGKYLYTDVPFLSISSVVNGDGVTIAPSQYRLEPRNYPRYTTIRLNRNSSQVWWFDDEDAEIAITGKWGWSEAPPEPVAEACRHYAGWMHQRWISGLSSSGATDQLGVTKRQITSVPPEVKNLLEPFVWRSRIL